MGGEVVCSAQDALGNFVSASAQVWDAGFLDKLLMCRDL